MQQQQQPVDAGVVVGSSQLVAQHKSAMLASLHNTKRRLTAQFNEVKKKEDEEKTNLVETISSLYTDLLELNVSIERQKNERKQLAEANKKREQQEYTNAFVEVVNAVKKMHSVECEDRRRVIDAMNIDLEERRTVLRSKQSAQLASLNPPRELTKVILEQTFAMERLVAETEAMCHLLTGVVDVEKIHFERNIVAAESADRNSIFAKEEARLLADKKAAEDEVNVLRAQAAKEKNEKEMVIAQLILQQRQHQGASEMLVHEIRELERQYDQHEKAVAERRFKKTAAYKFQLVQGALNTGLIKPLKTAAKVALDTTEAIIPIGAMTSGGRHEPPPSAQELERRSEEKRAIRDQCAAYLSGLKQAKVDVEAETAWMEEQIEMVKALLHNDELGLEQLSARIREILHRRRPADDEDGEEGDGDDFSGTLGHTLTSRRSESSAQMSRWS